VRAAAAVLAAGILALAACALDPPHPDALPGVQADALPPPGSGSLRQEEISLEMRPEGLRVEVTPLAEEVVRLAAPDSYERLLRLRRMLGTDAALAGETALLVTVQALRDGVVFDPAVLRFERNGRPLAPADLRPATGAASGGRLGAGETALVLVRLDGPFRLDDELRVEYGDARATGWRQHLPRFQDERRRMEGRAG
jgi:hypothetical protein